MSPHQPRRSAERPTPLLLRGRGPELSRTLDWVHSVLTHRAYLSGTRYYQTAESFLFFFSQLLPHLPRTNTHTLTTPPRTHTRARRRRTRARHALARGHEGRRALGPRAWRDTNAGGRWRVGTVLDI